MSEGTNRAPRTFKLENLEEAENEVTVHADAPKPRARAKPAATKKQPKQKTKTRKPRAVKETAVLRSTPDHAAQRSQLPQSAVDELADSLTPPPPVKAKKRFRWSRVLWVAICGIVSLGFGLWVDQLIRDLFSRQDWLGWLAVGFVALLVLAAFAIVGRELMSLRRMATIENLRKQAERAKQEDDRASAVSVSNSLIKLYQDRPDTARGRTALSDHKEQIIDGCDLILLAERDLLRPLDEKARAMVMGSAKRVSVVTAVSPRAIVDIGYVLIENARLIRGLAELYGGRPSTFGFWRLARAVIGHLAVTGTIAIGDGLVQQLVGQGLAAKISSRLGEGVVNGLLTARIGISAIDVCRPLEFSAETRPTIRDFLGELTSFSNKDAG